MADTNPTDPTITQNTPTAPGTIQNPTSPGTSQYPTAPEPPPVGQNPSNAVPSGSDAPPSEETPSGKKSGGNTSAIIGVVFLLLLIPAIAYFAANPENITRFLPQAKEKPRQPTHCTPEFVKKCSETDTENGGVDRTNIPYCNTRCGQCDSVCKDFSISITPTGYIVASTPTPPACAPRLACLEANPPCSPQRLPGQVWCSPTPTQTPTNTPTTTPIPATATPIPTQQVIVVTATPLSTQRVVVVTATPAPVAQQIVVTPTPIPQTPVSGSFSAFGGATIGAGVLLLLLGLLL